MIVYYQLSLSIINMKSVTFYFIKFVLHFYFYEVFIIYLSLFLQKYYKLNDKTQLTSTILIIDPYNHTHLYINNTLKVYLTNQMLE